MNDDQLTHYAAIEARLPEVFPRLAERGLVKTLRGIPAWIRGSQSGGVTTGVPLSDLERLGFGVLVLRAAYSWLLTHSTMERVNIAKHLECAWVAEDQSSYLELAFAALESAYPEGAQP